MNKLFVEETGTAHETTILLLHGLGLSSWMWSEITPLLPAYHCLLPDLPGHGQSNRVPWESITDAAEQVAQLIKDRGKNGRSHIVSLSLGSYIAVELLHRYPALVNRAVLSGLNVLPMKSMGWMLALMMPFIKTERVLRMNAKALKIPEASYPGYRNSMRQVSRRAFWQASRNAVSFRLPAQMAKVTVPTLMVAGALEHDLILQSTTLVAETMPQATARFAPDVGHGWSGEVPSLFAAVIKAWLEERPLPANMLHHSSHTTTANPNSLTE